MKNHIVAVLFLMTIWCAAASGGTVSIQPATVPVNPGQTFSVNVTISNVTDLFAYQFDIGFNPTVLAANSIVEGPLLGTGGATLFIPGTIDNAGGTITSTADSLFGAIKGVSGSGVLATVSFRALAGGTSAINPFNAIFLDSTLSGIVVTSQSGTVNVSGAPEPGTALLLGLGAALFGLVRLRARGVRK